MFDVFSIQFSRYGRRIAGMHLWRFARHQHSGTYSWELIPGCSSHAKHSDVIFEEACALLRSYELPHRTEKLLQYIKNVWQPPALPYRLQYSTIGRTDLHRRVRDGNGCCFRTHRHQTDLSMFYSRLHENLTETQPLLSSLERR